MRAHASGTVYLGVLDKVAEVGSARRIGLGSLGLSNLVQLLMFGTMYQMGLATFRLCLIPFM